MKKFTYGLLGLVLGLVLVACGGGGGGSPGTATGAGTPQPIQAAYAGPITGFGSVIVNGTRFSTIAATMTDDDGASIAPSQLRIGATVRVFGSSDDATQTGSASSIELVHGTQGLVSQVNTASSSFVVLGQTVLTNANTAYQGLTGLSALAVGDSVEVYGAIDPNGSLLATLVEKKSIGGVRVSGLVAGLNSVAKSFTLGTLTVDFSSPGVVVRGTLRNGALVRVVAASAPASGSTTLVATRIKVVGDLDDWGSYASGTIKIKGVASAAPVNGMLQVAGLTVDVSGAVLKGGSAITAGSFLEIKGQFKGSTLVASVVEFDGYHAQQNGGRNELYGVVTQWTSQANFVVDGVTVDASAIASLPTLATGTYVEVKGAMQGNVLKASQVKLGSGSTPSGGYFEMQGSISGYVSAADFMLNGVHVDASKAVFEHGSAAQLANGVSIEAKGALNNAGVYVASKVELQ